MSESVDLPNIQGYVSIKEAARILGLAERTVYEYVEEGRLPAVRAADVILVAEEDLANFKRGQSGRPRKNTPPWRISSGNNTQFMMHICVQIKSGQQKALEQKLEEMRKSGEHIFPGTVTRTIASSETKPEQITIVLIWRGTVMPDEKSRKESLAAFQNALAQELDWSTAQYEESTVLMHT